MANGILTQLNKALEITLRDGLDGLEDFTLQMAYAHIGEQFEVLSIHAPDSISTTTNVTQLKLVSQKTEPETVTQHKRHG